MDEDLVILCLSQTSSSACRVGRWERGDRQSEAFESVRNSACRVGGAGVPMSDLLCRVGPQGSYLADCFKPPTG